MIALAIEAPSVWVVERH